MDETRISKTKVQREPYSQAAGLHPGLKATNLLANLPYPLQQSQDLTHT
jgi:hypothetical protein